MKTGITLLCLGVLAIPCDGQPAPAPYREIVSVSLGGSEIQPRPGAYHSNAANKWTSIDGLASKLRTTDAQPVFLIKDPDRTELVALIRLSVDDGTRYFYLDGADPSPTSEFFEYKTKEVSPGVFEVAPIRPLRSGEYAFWKPAGRYGGTVPKKSNHAEFAKFAGGNFWSFGVDAQ